MLTISAAECGTPTQPVVPANQFATVQTGAVEWPDDGMGAGKSSQFNLPSAAGIPRYWAYFNFAQSMNLGVLPTGPWDYDPNHIATQAALSNAVQQEWIGNPASGHNTVLAS